MGVRLWRMSIHPIRNGETDGLGNAPNRRIRRGGTHRNRGRCVRYAPGEKDLTTLEAAPVGGLVLFSKGNTSSRTRDLASSGFSIPSSVDNCLI